MNTKPVILIVTPPGDLQIGLQALLTVWMEADVLVIGGASSALKIVERYEPTLVILDHDLSGDTTPMIVNQIKASWTEIRCVVLVKDEESRQRLSGSAADLVVIKGIPGVKLVAAIKELLPPPSETSP